MSTAVRKQSLDVRTNVNLRRQSIVDVKGGIIGRPSMDGARAAMILTSAQSRMPSNVPKMENTYRTDPSESINSCLIKPIIKNVLEEALASKVYDPAESTMLSSKLSDVIKQRVKEIGNSRYKVVVVVAIGPTKMSTVAFSSRCVWNASSDTYAECTYNNGNLYALGLVYGVYLE